MLDIPSYIASMRNGDLVNGKHLRHKWTTEDRTVLAVLYRFYSNPKPQLLKIWNAMYKHELLSEGFPSMGYALQPWESKAWRMKHGGVGARVWQSVRGVPLSKARRAFTTQKDAIEDAAQNLRIELQLKLGTPGRESSPVTTSVTSKHTNSQMSASKPTQRVAIARADEWYVSSSDEDDEPQDSPCLQRRTTLNTSLQPRKTLNATLIQSFAFDARLQATPSLESAAASDDRQQNDEHAVAGRPQDRPSLVTRNLSSPGNPRQPTLLFRAFLPAHGFRSRKFLKTQKRPPPPPPVSSETYLDMVDPHLRFYRPEDAKYNSPFISLTESPRRALEILAERQLEDHLSLAIFETNAISDDGMGRYGEMCMPYPYLVPSICRIHEITDLPGKYTGTGEFLVWGSIECQPIAVIDYGKAEQLLRVTTALQKSGKVSWRSGQVLGPCLSGISDKWKETVAYKLIRNFRVKGYLKGAKGDDYDDFIKAIYAASRGDRAASIFSEAAELTPRKTIPVVEIPGPAHSRVSQGKEKVKASDIEWHTIEDDETGRRISAAMPKVMAINEADDIQTLSSDYEGDEIQDMINAQLQFTGLEHGLSVDSSSPASSFGPNTPPHLFLQQLQHQAAIITPPPIPPTGYGSSAFGSASEVKHNSETMIIDLCEEDEDADDKLRELPSSDLTDDHDKDEIEDDDCSIIAAATRRGGGHTHSALSIRSRSLSNAISTPTRSPKRGRGRGFQNSLK